MFQDDIIMFKLTDEPSNIAEENRENETTHFIHIHMSS